MSTDRIREVASALAEKTFGAVYTERAGRVERDPIAYRRELVSAFVSGYAAASALSVSPAAVPAEPVLWQWKGADQSDDKWIECSLEWHENIKAGKSIGPFALDTRALYTEPLPLPCGHPASLLLKSAETGEPLYCELCDSRSGRRDAEAMETELRAKLAEAEETIAQLSRATVTVQIGASVNQPSASSTGTEAQWIAVSERLPADDQSVFCAYWPYNNKSNRQSIQLCIFEAPTGNFLTYTDGDEAHPPSHWMPAPEMPTLPALPDARPDEQPQGEKS